MNHFLTSIRKHTGEEELRSRSLSTIQINLGLRCNLECRHCHVGASPRRHEEMAWPAICRVLDLANRTECRFVDLTGGAPELHSHFRRLVVALRRRDITVQMRTNLTVLLKTELKTMSEFLRDHQVRLVASMPCYLEQNVDAQRGKGTYDQAIEALQMLNSLGYGKQPEQILNLVFNPGGAHLPPCQNGLESDYRRVLRARFGIEFTNLITIANMPIGRFRADLRHSNQESDYWNLLHQSFNPATLDHLMCRNQVSVSWDGTLYDCDFNLALAMPVSSIDSAHVNHCNPKALARRSVVTGDHCFACTAGSGSSCSGALIT